MRCDRELERALRVFMNWVSCVPSGHHARTAGPTLVAGVRDTAGLWGGLALGGSGGLRPGSPERGGMVRDSPCMGDRQA